MDIARIPELNATQLQPWLNKPEMLAQCARQIQKDLAPYGIKILMPLEDMVSYNHMFEALRKDIQGLLYKNSSLKDILYRVDVPESWIQKVAFEGDDFSTSLTRLIVWRELQKVVTRFILSQTTDNLEGDL